MNKLEINKEIKEAYGEPINNIVKRFVDDLPEDIRVLMALGYKFELFAKQQGDNFKITIRSHDKLSILKDDKGNIINILKQSDEKDRI